MKKYLPSSQTQGTTTKGGNEVTDKVCACTCAVCMYTDGFEALGAGEAPEGPIW